jgi:hypothetical protein
MLRMYVQDGDAMTTPGSAHGSGTFDGRHTSTHLRRLFAEVERCGSGSRAFWRLFWASLRHLREEDLERLLPALGTRADDHFAAVNAALKRRQRMGAVRPRQ